MQEYKDQPDPCKRLAYFLEVQLEFHDQFSSQDGGLWPPFVETARAAVTKLQSSDEELRKDAFRDLFRLRQLFEAQWKSGKGAHADHFLYMNDLPAPQSIPAELRMRWDQESCIPVYPCGTRASFADVQIREQPEDEVLRKLYRNRSFMTGLSKRHHRCKAELKLLNVLIDQRESELLTSARQ